MNKFARVTTALSAALSAAILMGCPATPASPSNSNTVKPAGLLSPTAALSDAPSIGFEPVSKGVYVSVSREPLLPETLAKAKTPRDQVLKVLKSVLQPAAPLEHVPATKPASSEAPPLAVKLYLQGRQRFLEGANSDAMMALEKALQIDPEAFTVLRLMGRVCFAASQLPRGATYLERAHALHPDDVEVNYMLGRYWLERGDFNRAAFYLIQAQDSPESQITSTQTPLSSFYLAIALQQAGFHYAAAKEYEHFIELSQLPVAGYRYDAEMSYLISMEWSSHLSVAENEARIGDYRAALPHYRLAAAGRTDDPFIASRLVNALVHDGQLDAARKAAMNLVAAAQGAEDSVKLLDWTYTAAGKRADLLKDLAAALGGNKKDEAQGEADTITLAAAMDYLGKKTESFSTLRAFAEAHPARLGALERLLERVDSAATFGQAVHAAGHAIASDPKLAEGVLRLFSPIADSSAGEAYLKTDPKDNGNFAELYLVALTRRAHHAPPAAIEATIRASALSSPPEFFASRQALVAQLLGEEKFAEADQLIQQVAQAPAATENAWRLRIDAEIAQERFIPALALAKEAKSKFPQDTDIRMQLVSVYRVRGQNDEADAELRSLIKDNPKSEVAYRLLVNSLFQRARRGGNAEANMAPVISTVNSLLAQIPDSRFARITAAIVYARGGRYDEAQTVLRNVLAADPDNAEALIPLAQIRQIAGNSDAADLLEASLKRKPQADVVRSLAALYRDQNRKTDALTLTKRMADENANNEGFAVLYAAELADQEKVPEAAAFLADTLKRIPQSQTLPLELARLKDQQDDHVGAIQVMRNFIKASGETTERLYLLSHYYSQAGNDDAAVAALQKMLTIMPDNIGANNDLGYFWANAGIHLDQAEPMIRKALENKPDDPAFIDSLGWLYYKQGKFDDAAALLSKAVDLPGGSDADVIRHLGDALYRLDRGPEAIERWSQALQRLTLEESLNKAQREERDYLSRVLAEARAGRTAPVSAVAQPESPKSAGPASAPATFPH